MTTPRPRLSALIVLALAAALVLAGNAGEAVEPTRARKIVVVVANRVLLSDLNDPRLPIISRMLRHGAAGLISPNCAGAKSERSVLLTAGAGASSRGGDSAREVYDSDEQVIGDQRAGDAYFTRTGRRAREGSAAFLGLALAQRESTAAFGGGTLGALGESVHRAGLTTCAIGTADLPPDTLDRSSALLAMDANGSIDIGRLRQPAEPSRGNAPPFLVGAGWLRETALECLRRADLVVVNFGDTTRLEELKLGVSDAAYAKHKLETLRSLDSMLHRLLAAPEAKGAIVVLASFSPPVEGTWDSLTPVVVYPSPKSGLLVSSTTRTPGVIAASDFAPTVLGLMGIAPAVPMTGSAATVTSAGGNVETLQDIDTRVTRNKALLTPMMWVIAALSALPFLGSAVVLGLSLRAPRSLLLVLRGGILMCASFGLAMLLAALGPASAASYAVWTAVLTVAIAAAGYVAGSMLKRGASKGATVHAAPVVAIFLMTVVVIVVDALLGGKLCRFALPSSFYISGLRYYGIGNEYAALLIFMGGLGALFCPEGPRRWLVPALGAIVTVALGVGGFGANYGGTAAAVVTFYLLTMAVWRRRVGLPQVVYAALGAVAVVLAFAALDWSLTGTLGSHAGRVAGSVMSVGGNGVPPVVLRKVLLNLRLTFGSNATRLYAIFAPLLVLYYYGIDGKVRRLLGHDARMMPGLRAIWIGAAAAYLANDSGAVMVCLAIAMMVTMLLYSLVEERLGVVSGG